MADRPAHRDAPDPELEVTPQTIEAGVSYWMRERGGEWPAGIDVTRDFFANVYRAMAEASRPERDKHEAR